MTPLYIPVRHPDVSIIRRERNLPGLSALLDMDELRVRLEVAGVPAVCATPTYLRLKPATSAVAGVRLDAGDSHRYARVVAYPVGAHRKLERLARRADAAGGLLMLDDRVGLAVCTDTCDPDLPGIRSARTRHPYAEVLVYKPGRRWVARCSDCEVLLKVHTPARAAEVVSAHRSLERLVPTAPIVEVDDSGVVVTRLLPGRGVADLAGGDRHDAEVRTGIVLARLHRHSARLGRGSVRTTSSGAVDDSQFARGLHTAAAGVAAIAPTLAGRADALADRVVRALAGRGERTLVHGDFSADQVLLDRWGAPILIDLDRAGIGDPLLDPAAWVADAIARGAEPEHAGAGLRAGYRAGGGRIDDAALAAHTAGALLHRAVEPFRRRRSDWDIRAHALIATAETMIAGGDRRPPADRLSSVAG
ncbi:phosphotransferase family protein [Millisia brevis]|uniref:phosphotransferase family protein n=1 Tax=Millisia brevis TaxID=264148 RepID=UPI00083304B2|nr:phosphotransferase [Millisia brevis]